MSFARLISIIIGRKVDCFQVEFLHRYYLNGSVTFSSNGVRCWICSILMAIFASCRSCMICEQHPSRSWSHISAAEHHVSLEVYCDNFLQLELSEELNIMIVSITTTTSTAPPYPNAISTLLCAAAPSFLSKGAIAFLPTRCFYLSSSDETMISWHATSNYIVASLQQGFLCIHYTCLCFQCS